MSDKKQKKLNLVDSLRNELKKSGLTQEQIEERSGVPQSTLSRFMSGSRGVTLATASKLFDALGLILVKDPNDTPRK